MKTISVAVRTVVTFTETIQAPGKPSGVTIQKPILDDATTSHLFFTSDTTTLDDPEMLTMAKNLSATLRQAAFQSMHGVSNVVVVFQEVTHSSDASHDVIQYSGQS